MEFKKIGQTMADYIGDRKEFYRTDADKEKIVEIYREGFPEGTNPIFNERREYDCNTCFHFLRNMGQVVDENGKSILRASMTYPLDVVLSKVADYVEGCNIVEPFLTDIPQAGKMLTVLQEPVLGHDKFYHFFYNIEQDGRMFDKDATAELGRIRGRMTALGNVLAVDEEVLDTVLGYINEGIYRGDTYKAMVESAKTLKPQYDSSKDKNLFLARNWGEPASHLKGSAMWILIDEIVKGTPLQDAEKKYLMAVDPTNYMRAKSIASERQVKAAQKFLKDEGYSESIFRRHATLADIEHHTIWESTPKSEVTDQVDDILGTLPTKPKKLQGVTSGKEVSLSEAMRLIDKADSVQIAVTESDRNHIAIPSVPLHKGSKPMYRWGCGFGWTYEGGVSDVTNIAKAVKKHGGNITAPYRVSLAWFACDDLDLHIITPKGHIYFGDSCVGAWKLDVDMNAGGCRDGKAPIENIYSSSPEDGKYIVKVHQYSRRSNFVKEDFYVEIATPNVTKVIHYPRRLSGEVIVAEFEIVNGKMVNFKSAYQVSDKEVEAKWYDVSTILSSPEQSTLHHTFFVLDGYKYTSDEKIRGLFIDAMKPELKGHRKVLELVGDKTAFNVEPNGAIVLGIADGKDGLNIPIKIDGKPYKIVSSK